MIISTTNVWPIDYVIETLRSRHYQTNRISLKYLLHNGNTSGKHFHIKQLPPNAGKLGPKKYQYFKILKLLSAGMILIQFNKSSKNKKYTVNPSTNTYKSHSNKMHVEFLHF